MTTRASTSSAGLVLAGIGLASYQSTRPDAELKVPAVVLAGTQDRIVASRHHSAHPEQVKAAIEEIAGQVGEPVHVRTPEAEALARASESGI